MLERTYAPEPPNEPPAEKRFGVMAAGKKCGQPLAMPEQNSAMPPLKIHLAVVQILFQFFSNL